MEDEIWPGVVERVREARESAGMDQTELGEAVGLSKGAIGNYERLERRPSLAILREIAKVTKRDLAWLISGASYKDPLEQIVLRLHRIEATLATVPGVSAPPELPVELGRFDSIAPPTARKAPRKSSRRAADAH